MQKNELPFSPKDGFGKFRFLGSIKPLGILILTKLIGHREMQPRYFELIKATPLKLNLFAGSLMIHDFLPSSRHDPVSIIPPDDDHGLIVPTEDLLRYIFKNGKVFIDDLTIK